MSDVPELASDALDHLVNQFSERLSFFRELIQNAVDAGSKEVDVWFDFEAPKPGSDEGVMIIDVDDYGEGMDRQIIETRLTRLFSSAKDGDLTKIGKFGIGFVSVFAIQPDAVCVDTSRAGESWRVLFKKDRSFSLIARDMPVEGTKIKIIKSVTEDDFNDFEERSYQTLKRWCKHLDAEVRFQDEPVNEPFEVADCPVHTRHVEKGTEIVAGYTRDGSSHYGFYNKGLTLLEGSEEAYAYPGVAYKVSSRYLEHTLTRDRIIEDNNFKKAMKIVERLVRADLIEQLFAAFEQRLEGGADASDDAWLRSRITSHIRQDARFSKSIRARHILRSVSGPLLSLEQVLTALKKKRLVTADSRSELTDALQAEGFLVAERKRPETRAFLAVLEGGGSVRSAESLFGLPIPIEPTPESATPLLQALERLLERHGAKVSNVVVGRFVGGISGWPAVSQRELGALVSVDEKRELGTGFFARSRALVIQVEHPTVNELVTLAEREPELAAYTLVKLFFLGSREGQALVELDAELGSLSVQMRERRLQSSPILPTTPVA